MQRCQRINDKDFCLILVTYTKINVLHLKNYTSGHNTESLHPTALCRSLDSEDVRFHIDLK